MRQSILFVSLLVLSAHLASASEDIWYRAPFRIQAGEKPLDIADTSVPGNDYTITTGSGAGGHAAPFLVNLVDFPGNSRRDLIVGGLGNKGIFRRYRNLGTDAAPRFDACYSLLIAGDKPAQVPIGCCIGAEAFFGDLDGSGVLGFVSGGFDPGFVCWFKGIPGNEGNLAGTFASREILLDDLDQPISPHPFADKDGQPVLMAPEFWKQAIERGIKEGIGGFAYTITDQLTANGTLIDRSGKEHDGHFLREQYGRSDWSTAALVNWHNEEWPQESKSRPAASKLDLLIGTGDGRVLMFKNVGTRQHPVFSSKPLEITINGEKAIPGYHAGITVADWDGDGLFDLIVGSEDGSVYLFRNSGKLGAPKFDSREILLGPGECCETHYFGAVEQWLERGESPRRGGCAQIQVVDYNRDGKPDILVGDYSITITPRSDLSPEEEAQMRALHAQMENIINKYGGNLGVFTDRMRQSEQGQKDRIELSRLRQKISPYLEKYDSPNGFVDAQYHGFVWVYLHR